MIYLNALLRTSGLRKQALACSSGQHFNRLRDWTDLVYGIEPRVCTSSKSWATRTKRQVEAVRAGRRPLQAGNIRFASSGGR